MPSDVRPVTGGYQFQLRYHLWVPLDSPIKPVSMIEFIESLGSLEQFHYGGAGIWKLLLQRGPCLIMEHRAWKVRIVNCCSKSWKVRIQMWSLDKSEKKHSALNYCHWHEIRWLEIIMSLDSKKIRKKWTSCWTLNDQSSIRVSLWQLQQKTATRIRKLLGQSAEPKCNCNPSTFSTSSSFW